MQIGPFAGPIWTIILIVDCMFFLFLEWWMPREDLDYVNVQWDVEKFTQASLWHFLSCSHTYHLPSKSWPRARQKKCEVGWVGFQIRSMCE